MWETLGVHLGKNSQDITTFTFWKVLTGWSCVDIAIISTSNAARFYI